MPPERLHHHLSGPGQLQLSDLAEAQPGDWGPAGAVGIVGAGHGGRAVLAGDLHHPRRGHQHVPPHPDHRRLGGCLADLGGGRRQDRPAVARGVVGPQVDPVGLGVRARQGLRQVVGRPGRVAPEAPDEQPVPGPDGRPRLEVAGAAGEPGALGEPPPAVGRRVVAGDGHAPRLGLPHTADQQLPARPGGPVVAPERPELLGQGRELPPGPPGGVVGDPGGGTPNHVAARRRVGEGDATPDQHLPAGPDRRSPLQPQPLALGGGPERCPAPGPRVVGGPVGEGPERLACGPAPDDQLPAGPDHRRARPAARLAGRHGRQGLPPSGGELGRGRVLDQQAGVEHGRRLVDQHRAGDRDPAEEDEHGRGGGGPAQPAAAAALVGDLLGQAGRGVDGKGGGQRAQPLVQVGQVTAGHAVPPGFGRQLGHRWGRVGAEQRGQPIAAPGTAAT